MAIPTSRVREKAEIRINPDKCNGCGKCVSVCKDFNLILERKKIKISDTPIFGCIGCGHCMAICPTAAIEIYGRTISPDDLFEIPDIENSAGYNQLMALYERRRSIREFREKEVDPEIIEKILSAAKTSPMGLPPSDVNVLILDSREKTRLFARDFCSYLDKMQWFVSKWFLAIMRPFWGKANIELFKGFLKPLFKIYTGKMKEGVNLVNYDAPLAMYFYGSPYTDPADPIVAATVAMYAGESLGLGTCMLGCVHPLIQNGERAKEFRKRHGIKFTSREGLFVIFGYPDVNYKKGIKRTFASQVIMKTDKFDEQDVRV